jgi:hypothetical protein
VLNSILVYNCDLLFLAIWGACPRPTIRVVITRKTGSMHSWRGGTNVGRVPAMTIPNQPFFASHSSISSSSRNEASTLLLLSGVREPVAALLF